MLEQVQSHRERSPSWGIVLRVWWLFIWRSSAMAIAAGAVLGIAIGFAGTVLGVDPHLRAMLSGAAGFASGLLCSVVAIRMALQNRYDGFALTIIRTGTAHHDGSAYHE